jgi:hypothetical protein
VIGLTQDKAVGPYEKDEDLREEQYRPAQARVKAVQSTIRKHAIRCSLLDRGLLGSSPVQAGKAFASMHGRTRA